MNILGINIGIGASVCLIKGNEIICALQEERITREKNYMGFPEKSLIYLCRTYPDIISSLDAIGIAGTSIYGDSKEEFLKIYKYRDHEENLITSTKFFYETFLRPHLASFKKKLIKSNNSKKTSKFTKKILEILKEYGNYEQKIFNFNHHLCHAATVYYSLATNSEYKYLIFTLDGGGDNECATISIASNGHIKKISTTKDGNSIGNIYSNTTYVLGFTPHEHEYKLMGLSSYVPKKHSEIAKNIYSKYLGLDKKNGLTFQRYIRESTANISPRLRRDFKKIRFDNMAAGLQYFTEELIIQWIKNAIKHTGIKKILLSGGVFMNIKLNKLISELSEVESVNVFPSCGDESNVFGASFLLFNKLTKKRLFPFGPYTLGPLPNINLEEIKKKYSKYCTFTEVENPNYEIAKSLSEGKIIGRCSGRMEFGARALGNRSILADPSSHEIVERVNFLIKQRDFWMPFAPAIRKEDVNEYLKIPDSLKDGRTSPYMMFGFDTTHKRSDMVATIHRSDKTARCEIVHKEIAPDLHEILTFFKKNTGRGVVMNTSLNIHGDPIAMDSNDAIEILINSDLEEIYIENILVKKSKL